MDEIKAKKVINFSHTYLHKSTRLMKMQISLGTAGGCGPTAPLPVGGAGEEDSSWGSGEAEA